MFTPGRPPQPHQPGRDPHHQHPPMPQQVSPTMPHVEYPTTPSAADTAPTTRLPEDVLPPPARDIVPPPQPERILRPRILERLEHAEKPEPPRPPEPVESPPEPEVAEQPPGEPELTPEQYLGDTSVYIDSLERDPAGPRADRFVSDVSRSRPRAEAIGAYMNEGSPLSVVVTHGGLMQPMVVQAHPALVPYGAGIHVEGEEDKITSRTKEADSKAASPTPANTADHYTATPMPEADTSVKPENPDTPKDSPPSPTSVATSPPPSPEAAQPPAPEAATPEAQARFRYWVNILEERPQGAEEGNANAELPGMNLNGLDQAPEGALPYKLVMTSLPVDSEEKAYIANRLAVLKDDADRSKGMDSDDLKWSGFLDEIQGSQSSSAVGYRMVRVGGETEQDALAVARRVIASVLPADPTTRWRIEELQDHLTKDEVEQGVTAQSGAMVVHEGEASAFMSALHVRDAKATQDLYDGYVSVDRFRDLVKFPNVEPVHGMHVVEPRNFAVSQVFTDPDAPRTRMGHIVRAGMPVNYFELPIDDFRGHMGFYAASKGGKTQAIIRMLAEQRRQNPDLKVVLIDFKKNDVYGESFVGVLDAMGVEVGVNVVDPASDGVLGNLNFFRRDNMKTMEVINTSCEALVESIKEPEPRRVIGKHLFPAIRNAFIKLGVDPVTNKSKYKYGDQATVTIDMVMDEVDAAIVSKGFKSDTSGDLGGWTKGQVEDTFRGFAETLFQNGYGYDIAEELIATSDDITVLTFADQNDATREMAARLFIERMVAYYKANKPVGGDYNTPNMLIVLEETGGVLMSPEIAEIWTRVRGEAGISFVISQQDPTNLHPDIRTNTGSVFAGKQNTQENVAAFDGAMGAATKEDLQVLNSMRPGGFLYQGPTTPYFPVDMQFPENPAPRRYPTERVHGSEAIVSPGIDEKLYTRDVHAAARIKAEETVGANLQVYFTTLAMNIIDEVQLAQIEYDEMPPHALEQLEALRAMDPDVRGRMINLIAERTANDNEQIQNVLGIKDFAKWMRDYVNKQIDPNTKRPEPFAPIEMALSTGRFGLVVSELQNITTARPLEAPPELHGTFGVWGGYTAQEQRDRLVNCENDTIIRVTSALYDELNAAASAAERHVVLQQNIVQHEGALADFFTTHAKQMIPELADDASTEELTRVEGLAHQMTEKLLQTAQKYAADPAPFNAARREGRVLPEITTATHEYVQRITGKNRAQAAQLNDMMMGIVRDTMPMFAPQIDVDTMPRGAAIMDDLKLLIGGASDDLADKIYQEIVTAMSRSAKEQSKQSGSMTAAEMVEPLVNHVRDAVGSPNDLVGFPAFRQQLQDALDAAANVPAVDISDYGDLYGVEMPSPYKTVVVDGVEQQVVRKATEQIDDLLKMRAAYVKAADYEVHVSEVFFPPKRLDAALDQITRKQRTDPRYQGRPYQEIAQELGLPDSKITKLIAQGSPEWRQWQDALVSHVLFGGAGFSLPPATRQAMRTAYADHLRQMREIVKNKNEKNEQANT